MTDEDKSITGAMDREQAEKPAKEQETQSRRDFLIGLGKWSRAVIVGAVAGGAVVSNKPAQAGAWANRRGGGGAWANGRGGGGAWANRRGGLSGGSWVNRR